MTSRKKSVRRKAVSIDWRPLSLLGAWVCRPDGRKLFVYVAPDGDDWLCVAVEAPDHAEPRAVLADHGHRLIGQFASGTAAQRAAEGFARRWLRGRKKIDACDCDEVAA